MRERTIVLMSFSKTFAMTGWRLGCLLADNALISNFAKYPFSARPATHVQKAGVAALDGPRKPIQKMKEEYNKRKKFFVHRMNEIKGIECQLPEGAFYVFPNIEALGIKSISFCERVLLESKVATFPGVGFGRNGEYHFRVALTKPMETLEKATEGIELAVKKISKQRECFRE
jgi:aminotransferase